MCGTIQDQGGSCGVPLAACQLILATCQKLENGGRPACQYWQVASVVGKVPKLVKFPEPKHRAMRGVCLHIYYVSLGQ